MKKTSSISASFPKNPTYYGKDYQKMVVLFVIRTTFLIGREKPKFRALKSSKTKKQSKKLFRFLIPRRDYPTVVFKSHFLLRTVIKPGFWLISLSVSQVFLLAIQIRLLTLKTILWISRIGSSTSARVSMIAKKARWASFCRGSTTIVYLSRMTEEWRRSTMTWPIK